MGIHITDTHTDLLEGFLKYAVEMGTGAMIYITKFHEAYFRYSEVNKRGSHIGTDSMVIA
jgi:hypothetical protein